MPGTVICTNNIFILKIILTAHCKLTHRIINAQLNIQVHFLKKISKGNKTHCIS